MEDDTDPCLRNIVKEIMQECSNRKIEANKNFVAYVTRLLLMNPQWGIGEDFMRQRENVQQLVEYIIDDILQKQEEPRTLTLKIQFYFTCSLKYLDDTFLVNKKDLNDRLVPLRNNIARITELEEKHDLDVMYKKIVFYITLLTGLGDPVKHEVYLEALAALKSIVTDDELKEFLAFSKEEKYKELIKFAKIVAGIRLFNKDCGKGGVGIPILPNLIKVAANRVRDEVNDELMLCMQKVNKLTTIIDKYYLIRQTSKGIHVMVEGGSKISVDIKFVKEALIFYRQYEKLLRKILDLLTMFHASRNAIMESMEAMLNNIFRRVHMTLAIPVDVVFPLFEELWDIWELFQNRALRLIRVNVILNNLKIYSKELDFQFKHIEGEMFDSPSMTDADRLASETVSHHLDPYGQINMIRKESLKSMENINIEYLGFCCYKLTETDGGLIPGNPMNTVLYKNKKFLFSCTEGFKEFAENPEKYVNAVLDLLRRKPQLINYLQLRQDLEDVYNVPKLVPSQISKRACETKSMQTESNIIDETLHNPKYKWNIWDYKREALSLANISNCATRTTQTHKTGSKSHFITQTYQMKQMSSQTMKETYTNVPKPSVFIYGLRGRKDKEQFKIDLTRHEDCSKQREG